jgi:hypothetical protein
MSLNLFRMTDFSDKSCRENQNAYFTFNNFFQKSIPLNVEKHRMHFCFFTATVLHEHATVLRYTYIAYLVTFLRFVATVPNEQCNFDALSHDIRHVLPTLYQFFEYVPAGMIDDSHVDEQREDEWTNCYEQKTSDLKLAIVRTPTELTL